MKHKTSTVSLLILITAFVISSCATNKKVEKMLIGKWNPVLAENLKPLPTPGPDSVTIKVDTSTEEGTRKETNLTLPSRPEKKTEQLERLLSNEMRSPILIAIDSNKHIVEKYFPGKTVTGTWKLKKNGTRVAVKMNETGRKLTMNILELTDSTAIITEKLPPVELRIKYRKEK